MRTPLLMLCLAVAPTGFTQQAQQAQQGPTDAEIRETLVRASIALYTGVCPCPYTLMSNGQQCGERAAYKRSGGSTVACYATDITADVIARYRTQLPK